MNLTRLSFAATRGIAAPLQLAFIDDLTGELSPTGRTISQESFLANEEFAFGLLAELDLLAVMEESIPRLLSDPPPIRWHRDAR